MERAAVPTLESAVQTHGSDRTHPFRRRSGDWALLLAGAATLVTLFAIAAFVVWAIVAFTISFGEDTSTPLSVREHLDVYWPAWGAAGITLTPGLGLAFRQLQQGVD